MNVSRLQVYKYKHTHIYIYLMHMCVCEYIYIYIYICYLFTCVKKSMHIYTHIQCGYFYFINVWLLQSVLIIYFKSMHLIIYFGILNDKLLLIIIFLTF